PRTIVVLLRVPTLYVLKRKSESFALRLIKAKFVWIFSTNPERGQRIKVSDTGSSMARCSPLIVTTVIAQATSSIMMMVEPDNKEFVMSSNEFVFSTSFTAIDLL